MKKYGTTLLAFAIIFIVLLFLVNALNQSVIKKSGSEQYGYSSLISDLKNDTVKSLAIRRDSETANAGSVDVELKSGTKHTVAILDMSAFAQYYNEASASGNVNVTTALPAKTSFILSLVTPVVIMIIALVVLFFLIQQMQGNNGGGNRVMSFGKSPAKEADDKKKVSFSEVAGLEEEKEELKEIVEFLKNPGKFVNIGARIPKGVLLVGPPGTGKTYLSRAVAGEAGVPFFSISGSDFVEMFVGVGASRVRDLFEKSKKHSPCIVFIDEIDAVGRRRGAGLGGGHDEREQTLNQLLVEMDGFGVNEGVIVLAATNRPDILDPALLRPGRFDRQVVVGRPDVKDRLAVLQVHARNKKFDSEVDLDIVAHTTPGFTPADLENLLNEAALLAARDDKKEISMLDIRRAFVKVGVGTEKKSRVISEKDRRITAYHEAGHAILFEELPELESVHIISIIPTGRAAGYTMPIPSDDHSHMTKKRMEQDIIASLGGRAAEFIVLDDITTGASADIEHATGIARSMVTKYGMSDSLGPILFGNENEEVFIGRDIAHARNYGEKIASQIDSEIKSIIDNSYTEALRILREKLDVLHKTAALLIEKEKVTGEEFRKLLGKDPVENPLNEGVIVAPGEV
ncbi:MAG: ATP-dependent zinc metalloprotease FtsH [Clostridiales bacterium]|nr:ATP-dependent zinc metalloprotease FtsH [Clostridiales bacterium]